MKRSVAGRLTSLAERYALPPQAVDQLERLLAALATEPDPYTTVREPGAAVDHHIADSLCALELDAVRTAGAIADIGAGAGFPGLPLAVALPSARVDLLESAQRKCAVIERLAAAAGIQNARAVRHRAEEWAADDGACAYDIATARAVGPLPVLVEYAGPLLRLGGSLIAWKGSRDPREEEAGATAAHAVGLRPAAVVPVAPFEGARDLNLHLYLKERETPERFPRRPGMAAKRPLA